MTKRRSYRLTVYTALSSVAYSTVISAQQHSNICLGEMLLKHCNDYTGYICSSFLILKLLSGFPNYLTPPVTSFLKNVLIFVLFCLDGKSLGEYHLRDEWTNSHGLEATYNSSPRHSGQSNQSRRRTSIWPGCTLHFCRESAQADTSPDDTSLGCREEMEGSRLMRNIRLGKACRTGKRKGVVIIESEGTRGHVRVQLSSSLPSLQSLSPSHFQPARTQSPFSH